MSVAGISVPGVVGGVFGCLLAIAGAVVLCKTWRMLEVKRGGRNRKELVMLGGGGMTACAKPATAGTGDLKPLCCFTQARPRLPRLGPPWHSSDSKSPWRSSRSVRSQARLRLPAIVRDVSMRVCAHAIERACDQAPALHAPLALTFSSSSVGMSCTHWCGRVLQHVPYVKTMFGAVMTLKGACTQAVHNKERCAALAECVRIAAQPRMHCVRLRIRASVWDACVSPHPCVRAWLFSMSHHRFRCNVLAAACVSLPHARDRGGGACRWLEGELWGTKMY
jgi:hypothetical protein